MKTVTTRDEFLAMFDTAGKPIEPFAVGDRCALLGLTSVTSLAGLTMGDRCVMRGLTSVTSLDGLAMGAGCVLWDLTSVTSLDGLAMGDDCRLYGLTSVTSLDGLALDAGCRLYGLSDKVELSASPTAAEMKIINQIPLDQISMSGWHCGTSHCLAGWAQVIAGRDVDEDTAYADGCELLPSLSSLFFAPDEPVKALLRKLQSSTKEK